MNIQYFKNYSPALGRDMECKLYGQGGQPILFIPCQDGRFFDFENFQMTNVWAPWIDSGEVTIFTVDTIDTETWSNTNGDPRWRICRHEDWFRYLTDEMVPFIHAKMKEYQSDYINKGIIAFGCSLGATHAANLYFRRPDLFNGLLALSGIYDASYGFGSYMDDLVELTSSLSAKFTGRSSLHGVIPPPQGNHLCWAGSMGRTCQHLSASGYSSAETNSGMGGLLGI